jgi:hypothetical protein
MKSLKLPPVLVGEEKVFDQIRFVGLDVANSYVKIETTDQETVVYANTVKYLNESDKRLFMKEMDRKKLEELETDEIVFTYENKSYLIGTTDRDSIQGLDKNLNRHAGDSYKRSFLLSLARIANNGDNFVICTGVPSSYYNDNEVEESLQELVGNYSIDRNDIPVTFRVSFVHVELEPRGTYLSTIYKLENEKIYVKSNEIKDAKYTGVLDLGFGTSDLALFMKDSHGRVRLAKQPETLKTALSDAYQNLKENLKNKYKSISGMPIIELESELRRTGIIQPAGAPIPREILDKEVTEAFGMVAQNIISELKSAEQTDGLNYLIFTGGGMLALQPYLKNRIEGPYQKIMIKGAQTANAKGYLIKLYMLDKSGKLKELINEQGGVK